MKRVASAHLVLFLSLAFGGALLDLATKSLIFNWLVGDPPAKLTVARGVFSLTTSYNEGALWGIARKVPYANGVFAGLSIVAAGAILYWVFWQGAARDRMLSLALGLIMAGTLGNCYDRIVMHRVRDFLFFELIKWPIFNLADSCLVCGALVLMAHAFFAELPAGADATPITASADPVPELKQS